MKIFDGLLPYAISIPGARVMCALAGVVCAALVFAFATTGPQIMHASAVPQHVWLEYPGSHCGGCPIVGCVEECSIHLVIYGHECCDVGAREGHMCLFCGP